MNRFLALLFAATLLLPATAWAQADTDGDGVPDDIDVCPADDASFFDGDGDGCVDPLAHARHIEFWAPEDLPFTFVVHEGGARNIDIEEASYDPGQEIDEVVAGIALWDAIPGVDMPTVFAGTTPDSTADGTDGIHQVTFRDPDFLSLFGSAVLAVGLTTSLTEPGDFNGQAVRPGQIVDADMLFNPERAYSANTSFSAVEVQAIAVHEAGHLFGLNHSALPAATMFPALPAGVAALTLEIDDQVLATMSYPASGTIANLTSMAGAVIDGATGLPIPGAAVFALNAGTDQKVAVQYTLPDGTWTLAGLPAGDYDVFVAPLNGGDDVAGVVPGFINALVDSTAQTVFLPDFYDDAESTNEDPQARTSITLAPGAPVTGLTVVTNADEAPPIVTDVTPNAGEPAAAADGVVLVKFSEAIEFSTVSVPGGTPRFRLERDDPAGPVGVAGQLVALGSKDVLVFTPSSPLQFDAPYTLTIEAGVQDLFGNATPVASTSTFTVESAPPLAVDAVTPQIAAPGAVLVFSGQGFDTSAATNNTVSLGDGTPLSVQSVTSSSLIAQVPAGVNVGLATVDVSTTTETLPGAVTLEIVNPTETAQATGVTSVALSGLPVDLAILPTNDWTLVATAAGLEAVVAEGASPAFGNASLTPVAGGLDGIAVGPGGTRAYGVSRAAGTLVVFDTDDGGSTTVPAAGFLAALAEVPLAASPLGIAVDPTGREAWVTTAEGAVLVVDLEAGSDTQFERIGEITTGATGQTFLGLRPDVAFSRNGQRVYVLGDQRLHVVDAASRQTVSSVTLGAAPENVVESIAGDLIYVSDIDGGVSVVPVTASAPSQVIAVDGSLRGIAVGPGGGLGYVADRRDEDVVVVDLRAGSASFRTVIGEFPTGEDPIDVVVTPDGSGVFTISEGSQTLDVFGIGFGPVINSVFPTRVLPGHVVAIGGSGFALTDTSTTILGSNTDVDFDGTIVGATVGTENELSFWANVGWATVPDAFDGGPVRVESINVPTAKRAVPEPSAKQSNPAFVSVWSQEDVERTLSPYFEQSSVQVTDPLGGALSLNPVVHPEGDYVIADDGVEASFVDIREDSPTFLQVIASVPSSGDLDDPNGFFGATRAFTPDGKLIYTHNRRVLNYYDADVDSPTFGQRLGTVDFSSIDPNGTLFTFSGLLDFAISPNGFLLFVGANNFESMAYVQLQGDSANTAVGFVSTTSGDTIGRLRFHPNGAWMFMADSGGSLDVIDLDPFSANYLSSVRFLVDINSSDLIEDVAVAKDGSGLWALTRQGGLGGQWNLWWADFIDDPSDFSFTNVQALEIAAPSARTRMELHPNGLSAAITIPERRVAHLDLSPTFEITSVNDPVFAELFDITSLGLFAFEGRWSPDGERFFGVEQTDTVLRVWDQTLPGVVIGFVPVSGADQVGVSGQPLPVPVRLRAINEAGTGTGNVLVNVEVQSGGGTLEGGVTQRTYVADAEGLVAVDWTLGPNPGTNSLRITNGGGFGPSSVEATAVVEPTSVPLALSQVLPLDTSAGVSVTTAAQVVFSRAVDRATVPSGAIVLREATSGDVVPAYQGISDGDRRISLIPNAPLAFDTDYVVEVPATVADLDGNALGTAETSTFTTQAPAAPVLSAVSPPAATVGTPIVLTGAGFDPDPADNVVTVNGVPATVTDASINSLQLVVPGGATTGPVALSVNGTPAGSVELTVLVPSTVPIDTIDDSIELGAATQALAVLPDGLRGYAVSTSTDQVIPVDLIALTNGTPIGVGEEPVAAVTDVNGDFVYVANRGSNDVSVIDTATDSVVDTILLQGSPTEIVASPNGDFVYVVTPDVDAVEVIDVNVSSATYNTATARFTTGGTTSGASISPDGGILFLGTNDGFLTISLQPTDFGATARFTTGGTTSGASISPDGTLLILLTTAGEIVLVDIDGPGFGTATARFTTGGTTSGASISPDGAILYVITADTDEVLAFAINVTGSVSTIEGLFVVELVPLGSIDAGDDPRWLAFDPRDPSVVFVGATGDLAINVFGRDNDTPPPPCEAFDVVFGTSWDPEASLQEILDAEYGAGAIDAATDYEGFDCTDAAVPYWLDDSVDGWLVREIGDYRGRNTLGWYAEDFTMPTIDGVGDGVIFDGASGEGSTAFVGLPGPTRFGLYLNPNGPQDAINAPEPELFFTNRRYNDVGPDGSGAVHAPDGGDPQALIYDITALRNGVPTYVIAWEDVDSGAEITPAYTATTTDNDFNDLVIEVRANSPVSAVVSTMVAVPQADGVRLAWTVSGGVEIERAIVERKRGDADYAVVAEVTGLDLSDDIVDVPTEAGEYTYRVGLIVDGGWIASNEVSVSFAPLAVRTTELVRAYPNPFNPQTTIEYALARPGEVQLTIFDLAGRRVRTFDLGEQPIGVGTVQWTGLDDRGQAVSSGVYLVRLSTPDRTDALRVVLLK